MRLWLLMEAILLIKDNCSCLMPLILSLMPWARFWVFCFFVFCFFFFFDSFFFFCFVIFSLFFCFALPFLFYYSWLISFLTGAGEQIGMIFGVVERISDLQDAMEECHGGERGSLFQNQVVRRSDAIGFEDATICTPKVLVFSPF